MGPMFRHERPQKGRQRQFHQIGAEVLGAPEATADAETIEMVWSLLSEIGIEDRELRLGSVGDEGTRTAYRAALTAWLAPHLSEMCDDCKRRAVENPLRVFDCKVEADQRLLSGAPKLLDHLSGDAATHFGEVRALLDGYGIPFVIDPRLVRGLDYYVRTVFEITSGSLGAQNALLGGGRYDGLVQELGGPAVPGFGFAAGMERLVMTMPETLASGVPADVSLVGLGEAGFRATIAMARRLRAAGLAVLAPLSERPLGAQIKRAEKAGARYAVFVGESEMARGSYGMKDLATGEQVERDEAGIVAEAKR
jgi:histidyl-tRNA synthetase